MYKHISHLLLEYLSTACKSSFVFIKTRSKYGIIDASPPLPVSSCSMLLPCWTTRQIPAFTLFIARVIRARLDSTEKDESSEKGSHESSILVLATALSSPKDTSKSMSRPNVMPSLSHVVSILSFSSYPFQEDHWYQQLGNLIWDSLPCPPLLALSSTRKSPTKVVSLRRIGLLWRAFVFSLTIPPSRNSCVPSRAATCLIRKGLKMEI